MTDFSRLTICFSLPRSQSQWWTWLFGHGCVAEHDAMRHFASPKLFAAAWAKRLADEPTRRFFIADTGAIFFHHQLKALLPGVQCMYMFRNPTDVKISLKIQSANKFDAMIDEANALMFAHGFGQQPSRRYYHGQLNVDQLAELWPWVTGLPAPDRNALDYFRNHIVDVPLLQQPSAEPDVAKSLWAYRENVK